MIRITKSKVYTFEEIEVLGKELSLGCFLKNRAVVVVDDRNRSNLEEQMLLWIEETCESIVIFRQHGEDALCLYFQLESDLTGFVLRWQGDE